ncbi:MAG: SemiSWEET family transporter [Nanoarchaeota archaeon]
MQYIIIIKILATVMGIIMSLGYFPQAYKIYKNKSSKNISILSYIIFSLGTLTWLIYGISINDLPIILGFILGVIGSWLVLILTLIYNKK